MRFNLVWNNEYEYAGHRGINDPRPHTIEADRSEILYSEGGGFPIGLRFVKDDVAVATLFQLPVAVVAEVQE